MAENDQDVIRAQLKNGLHLYNIYMKNIIYILTACIYRPTLCNATGRKLIDR